MRKKYFDLKKLNKDQKILLVIFIFFIAVFLAGFYLPKSIAKADIVPFAVKKGTDYRQIGAELSSQGIIRSPLFFDFYTIISLSFSRLQAGIYDLSPSDSVAEIVSKIANGDTAKNKVTIIEGWDIGDIAQYFDQKKIYQKQDFINATKQDFSADFTFFKDKPKNSYLEGYIFPDTYYLAGVNTSEDFLKIVLSNFDQKLTPDLRDAISKQHKTIFQIVTMASMLEKEVQSLGDKKIVAGILWKRIKEGIPLQVDATVNYATRNTSGKTSIDDTKIDSPYNTYKYYGLPLGPISNPGMDSIMAAIYPTETDYFYYLSVPGTGQTVFSKTLDEHNANVAKYLK